MLSIRALQYWLQDFLFLSLNVLQLLPVQTCALLQKDAPLRALEATRKVDLEEVARVWKLVLHVGVPALSRAVRGGDV